MWNRRVQEIHDILSPNGLLEHVHLHRSLAKFFDVALRFSHINLTEKKWVLDNWSSLIDIWHTLISRIFENWLSCNLKCIFQQNKLINTLFQIQKTCQNAMLNSILLKYVYYIGTQPIFKKLVKSMSVICLLDSINCLRLPLSLTQLSSHLMWKLLKKS